MDRLDPVQRDLASRTFDSPISGRGATTVYPPPELAKLIRQRLWTLAGSHGTTDGRCCRKRSGRLRRRWKVMLVPREPPGSGLV